LPCYRAWPMTATSYNFQYLNTFHARKSSAMSPRSSSSKTTTTLLHTLTSPIRGLSLIGHAHPSTDTTVSTKASPAPVSWICHHCIYLLPLADSSSSFIKGECQGCGHERCGLCDVVYESSDKNADLVGAIQVPELWYHWDVVAPKSAPEVLARA
jgi:hypothetical protein